MTQQINPPTPPYGPPARPYGQTPPAPPAAAPFGPRPAAPTTYGQAPPVPAPAPPREQSPGYGQPPYGAPPGGYGQPPAAPPGGYGYPTGGAPQKKRTGLIVGVVVGVLVLAGLGVGAFFLFSPSYLDTVDAQNKIAALTQQQVGEAPSNVQCPSDVELASGTTFTCTASLEGQPISFTVRETDDNGNVEVTSDNKFVDVSKVEDSVSQQVSDKTGIDVHTTCDTGGKKVLVDGQGKPIPCTVTNASNSSDSIQVAATVDDQGNVTYEVKDNG